ncbi:MAG: ABC transporter permease, partial [Massilia sp.]
MLTLTLKMTMRDWRAGELRFLLAALTLAVASLSAVQFFAERMGAALERDAHQLLGADLRITSQQAVPAAWRDDANRRALHSGAVVELQSMARAGEGEGARLRMVSLKAVTPGYPLRGTLTLHEGSLHVPTHAVPAPGTAWADPALLSQLNLNVGATIHVGELTLTITHTIATEPDRGPAALMLAPRLLIAMPDLEKSGLVQGGSFAEFGLLLAGPPAALDAYASNLKAVLARDAIKGVTIDTLATSSSATGEALARAHSFLALIGLLSAMLASVAVAMAGRRFMRRHADACAMLRCLGMPLAQLTAMFVIEFLLLGLLASAIGVALGFGAHFLLMDCLGKLVTPELAPASWLPALHGMAVGVLLLVGFGLPPLLQMRSMTPNRLLRREDAQGRLATVFAAGAGLLSFGALMLWQAGELRVGLLSAAAFVVGLTLFIGLARAAVAALHGVPAACERGVWRLALADLRRRPGAAVTQVVALALGLMALLLLTVVRGDLFAAWRDTAPADAPNHMVINIQPAQRAAV